MNELELTPLVAIAVPLIGAFAIGLVGRWPNLREGVTLLTGAILLWVVLNLRILGLHGVAANVTLLEVVPGMPIALGLEPLGLLFALIASGLWILNSVYSIGYMRAHHEPHQTRFYICFAIAIACAMGMAFASNLFTLFIFYEALTLSTYPLVAHSGTPQAVKSARTYLGVLVGTSVCLFLLAMIWSWLIAGTLDFQAGGIFREALASGKTSPATIGLLFALFVFGTGKAAVMPMHRWLPAAMVAPTPVSALLHAVAVVKAGVFTVLKLTVYIFGTDTLATVATESFLVDFVTYAACFTIIVASVIALYQDNVKRRLAYSTVSQLSYIVLAASLLTPSAIQGGSLHMLTHAFGKITLFFCAGAIYVASHKTEVSQLRGIGRRMPVTMFCFLIASLSIIGLPPFGGTWSKWLIMLGAMEADQIFVSAVLLISSLLNIAYLLPVAINAFFEDEPKDAHAHESHEHGEAPIACLVPIALTAAGCLVLFIYPDPFLELVRLIGVKP